MPRTLVVALGGNALIQPGEEGTVDQQLACARQVAATLKGLDEGDRIVVVHGNGPQVGRVLLRSDLCAAEVPPVPIDVAVAATCGELGLLLSQALRDSLGRRATTVLTHVRVDLADPAFQEPTKYIGRFYTEDEARLRAMTLGWSVKEDPGRGWRRVVPSPRPSEVLEADDVRALLDRGNVVVACGGGGIPVARAHGRDFSVEAVVDKDHSAALLAHQLDADELVIVTGVDEVMLDFGEPGQRPLREVGAAELEEHLEAGQFPPGSMGPKIRAALDFLGGGPGRSVCITSPERLRAAFRGERGTRIAATMDPA